MDEFEKTEIDGVENDDTIKKPEGETEEEEEEEEVTE